MKLEWWRTAVIYQVYTRSFQDADGDGVGDLNGVAQRLSHLVDLGIDALWLSPIFPSPMCDFGYDVRDYCDIHPLFGTLADFDRLLGAAHAVGLRIILDFVPNHTSDRHPWFEESRSSRGNRKRDWYVWRDPGPDGSPPNNWESEFGGPAWTFDAASGQYYYHAYLKQQPDLNWRNPEVEQAMAGVLRFWFDRGVDGFRVDAIHHLIEDQQFRDNPPDPAWTPEMAPTRKWLQIRTIDQPEVHACIQAMRRIADAYPERVMIGEAYLPIDRLMAYYGVDLGGFHLPFNFHLISTQWRPKAIAWLIDTYEAALPAGAWPNWVLGNHDRSRVASRLGAAQARVAAMLLLTLRGTPTIYQGEEIGMTDVPIPPDLRQDPFERNVPGFGLGRDPERTPMPWRAGPGAGFTTGRPWLPLNADADVLNVARQASDPQSMMSLYRALIVLRRRTEILLRGAFRLLAATDEVLLYERRLDDARVLVALNMTDRPQSVSIETGPRQNLLSTCLDRVGEEAGEEILLRAAEGLVVALVRS
jgi:alpha-glucosidase